MKAIAWHGRSGAEQCESTPQVLDETDALVWALGRKECDLEGIVVEVGEEVCSFDVGDFVTVLDSVGDRCCSSSLWGLTEFMQEQSFGRLLRVPLAEFNLFPVRGAGAPDLPAIVAGAPSHYHGDGSPSLPSRFARRGARSPTGPGTASTC